MGGLRITQLLEEDHWEQVLRSDIRAGLTTDPKTLPPKWLYDEIGSNLFDQITRLEEYYPTRAETQIIEKNALKIAHVSGADTLVELGSGTSEKSRLLLDGFRASGQLKRYVPFDVSAEFLAKAAEQIAREYPEVQINGVVGDFELHIGQLPREGKRMIVFLGGTIGNLLPDERHSFFKELSGNLSDGETLLLGTDLVKDVGRLQAAYNDSQNITAEFNLNVLSVINKRLGGNFDLANFSHSAHYDTSNDWIEMLLVSEADQQVRINDLDLLIDLQAGESIRTEISAKFTTDRLESELNDAGLGLNEVLTDKDKDFALSLCSPMT